MDPYLAYQSVVRWKWANCTTHDPTFAESFSTLKKGIFQKTFLPKSLLGIWWVQILKMYKANKIILRFDWDLGYLVSRKKNPRCLFSNKNRHKPASFKRNSISLFYKVSYIPLVIILVNIYTRGSKQNSLDKQELKTENLTSPYILLFVDCCLNIFFSADKPSPLHGLLIIPF